MNTSAIHTRELIKKGYIKVLYHGYKGERAHTRQIVYKEDMKLEDIIAIAGESAPYLQENQSLTSGAKGEDMNKRSKKVSIKSDSKLESVGNDYQLVKDDRKSQLETIRRAVGEELFSIALQEAGKNATQADIERVLSRMLA
jgi:polynucleotide 5'-kinase involved in rRNA processing